MNGILCEHPQYFLDGSLNYGNQDFFTMPLLLDYQDSTQLLALPVVLHVHSPRHLAKPGAQCCACGDVSTLWNAVTGSIPSHITLFIPAYLIISRS